jgi:hypothetical protein
MTARPLGMAKPRQLQVLRQNPYLNITSIPSVKLEVLPLQSLDQAWKFQVSPIMNVTF